MNSILAVQWWCSGVMLNRVLTPSQSCASRSGSWTSAERGRRQSRCGEPDGRGANLSGRRRVA